MGVPAGNSNPTVTGPLVTLDDLHAHLNVTNTAHDTELQGFIDAATPVIEHITGPIIPESITEYHNGGGPYIVLRQVPIIAVTSITEYRSGTATVLTAAADPSASVTDSYIVEADTGIVRRYMGSGVAYQFWPGTQSVQVVYTAGYTVVPANVRMAALELIRVNYQQTQLGGGGHQFGGANPDMPETGAMIYGFFVPNRVREMLLPNQRVPGIA